MPPLLGRTLTRYSQKVECYQISGRTRSGAPDSRLAEQRAFSRHRLIVARVLGDDLAAAATVAIGVLEILLGIWAFSHRQPRACAAVQTAAIVAMKRYLPKNMNLPQANSPIDVTVNSPQFLISCPAGPTLGCFERPLGLNMPADADV